ncbi:hypothetical protein [Chitinophaga defluvii]|uniref:Uncharacterized protein n=1 Tax=Chitinophaga defluvii TaxID=3163343 RepID=A0ABV2T2F3_9BACT
MAKQAGVILLTGTIGNITFYEMDGQYYARMKSSLRGNRVKTDPAFALTMVYAERLALSSRTAAQLYRSLPADQRQVTLYRKMTSTAMQLLKAGIPAAMLADALAAVFQPVTTPKEKGNRVILQQARVCVSETGCLEWGIVVAEISASLKKESWILKGGERMFVT